MKQYFLNKNLQLIQKYYSYDSVKLSEIKYGLESFYITISKTIIIFSIAYLLNLLNELIIFFIFYSILRTFAHGVHTKKSWQCWLLSFVIFLIIPYLSKTLYFRKDLVLILSTILLLFINKYSPADTEKKPIINKKKRLILKTITSCITISYIIAIIFTKNYFIINVLFFSILLETILVLPISYKILGVGYNNYKTYFKTKVQNT